MDKGMMTDSDFIKHEEHRSLGSQYEPSGIKKLGIRKFLSATGSRLVSESRALWQRSVTDRTEIAARRWYASAPPGCRGLVNLGNTCYMNSALQCLSSTALLREFFTGNREYQYHLYEKNRCNSLCEAFSSLLMKMWSKQSSRFSVSDDLKTIQRNVGKYARRFSSFSQNDSQEFLTYLLEGLHNELNNPMNEPIDDGIKEKSDRDHETAEDAWARSIHSDNSRIAYLFYGLLRTCLTCGNQECRKKIHMCDAFAILPLPLPNDDVHLPSRMRHMVEDIVNENTITLRECLEMMTKETSTEGKNWFCDRCCQSVELKKKVDIFRAPEILILYLKRFCASRGSKYKLCVQVDFPEHLDLSPFLLEQSETVSTFYYDLYAIIDHHGSISGGHYTATTKRGKKWYLFDDDRVSQFDSLQEIKNTTSAYVLFYERKNKPPVVSTQATREICEDDELTRLSSRKKVPNLSYDDEHGQESSVDTDSCGSFTNMPSDPSLNSFDNTMETDRMSCSETASQNN